MLTLKLGLGDARPQHLCFGPLQVVRGFLDRHPNVINGEGNPLQYAILVYRLDVVLELLERGQDPLWPALEIGNDTTRQSEAFDALAFMLSWPGYRLEDYKLVCLFLKTVSPDILLRLRAPHQWCPSFIRLLLERGANAGHVDNGGSTALHHCLETTDDDTICLEIAQLLVDSGCPMDTLTHGKTPLAVAASRGITPVVHFLLERGCQVQEDILLYTRGSACFCLIFQRGGIPRAHAHLALRTLLRRSWPGRTEGLEIVKAFLDKGDVIPTWSLVMDAVSCDLTVAQYILDSCVNLTGDILRQVLLEITLFHSTTQIRDFLNDLDHPLFTTVDPIPLIRETMLQSIDSSELLLGRPASTLNLPSYFEMVTFLTRQNAHRLPPDVYKCDDDGATPLHELLHISDPDSFSAEELLEVVRSFVDTGCEILSPNGAGKTPLYLALILQHGDLVSYLVSKGANFSDVKDLHHIPLDWAVHLPWYQNAIAIAGCNGELTSIDSNIVNRFLSRKTYRFDGSRIDDQASLDASEFEVIWKAVMKGCKINVLHKVSETLLQCLRGS